MLGLGASGNWQHTTVDFNADPKMKEVITMVGLERVLFSPSAQVQNERVATRDRGFHASKALGRS